MDKCCGGLCRARKLDLMETFSSENEWKYSLIWPHNLLYLAKLVATVIKKSCTKSVNQYGINQIDSFST